MTSVGTDRSEGTQVVILDRRPFDRFALEILCEQTPGISVAASVGNVSEAMRALGRPGTVVLAGRQALLVDGPEPAARLRAAGAARVIMVGTGDRDWIRVEAMRVNADGFLMRDGGCALEAGTLRGQSDTVPRWRDEAAGGGSAL
jgi:DNA-binding NarL/FixJ family response regulator